MIVRKIIAVVFIAVLTEAMLGAVAGSLLTGTEAPPTKLPALAITALCVFGIIISIVLLASQKADDKHFTKAQKSKLKALTASDNNNAAENETARKNELEENKKRLNPVISKEKANLNSIESQLRAIKTEIKADKSLADKDKSLQTVSALIDYLESGRANSKKDALNLYDEYLREQAATAEMYRLEYERRSAMDKAVRDLQHEAEMASIRQENHNREMERLQREKNEKLDEIRKQLDS